MEACLTINWVLSPSVRLKFDLVLRRLSLKHYALSSSQVSSYAKLATEDPTPLSTATCLIKNQKINKAT